jgi:hypothetical protein
MVSGSRELKFRIMILISKGSFGFSVWCFSVFDFEFRVQGTGFSVKGV